jgi:hypothetical protein
MATLFSPTRGALLFSPFWFWAIGGWLVWWRSGRDRRDAVFTFAATFLLWLSIAAYPNWEGGWSLGMRYLVPIIFLAALPIPWALQTALSRGLFLATVVFSAALHILASSSYPHFPSSIAWPVANVSAFLVAKGAVAPNLGLRAGLPPLLSLAPVFAVIAAGLALCLVDLPRTRPPRALATVLGLTVFGATLLMPPAISPSDGAWREGLAETLSAAGPDVRRYNQKFQ